MEVFLSHDMVGYVGLEALVYRAFARVMEQTESGHVVVRKVGDKEEEEPTTTRNLNLCEGLVEGTKLAKVGFNIGCSRGSGGLIHHDLNRQIWIILSRRITRLPNKRRHTLHNPVLFQ